MPSDPPARVPAEPADPPSARPRPAAVLWDMDGTLVDTEPLWFAAEKEVAAALGGTWTAADQRALLGTNLAFAARELVRRTGADDPDRPGVERLLAQVAAMLRAAFTTQLEAGDVPTRPGALDLLATVVDAGVPSALVSSSVRQHMDIVLRTLPAGAFATTVAGDEVRRLKPDPEPFLLAAQRLGVDPSRCVVVEDSPPGVRSGAASGAAVLAVPHVVPLDAGGRVHVVESLLGVDLDLLSLLSDRCHFATPR